MPKQGQTLEDRLYATLYTISGQLLERCIFKATTEELMRPKKKHLDYLVACSHDPKTSMMDVANLLIVRTDHYNWAVVYKALISVHHLMTYGNERFIQHMATKNYTFQLDSFLDRNTPTGCAMSPFIRRYSKYINQKAASYMASARDMCRIKRTRDSSLWRMIPIELLLKNLRSIQQQIDALLDFNATVGDLSNSIITYSFIILFHDAIPLFAHYNDGIITLFESYFNLDKKLCREAFEAYKKFLACTERMTEFLKVAEVINLNQGDPPNFKQAPSSLLSAFEEHLLSLEGTKTKREHEAVIEDKPVEQDDILISF